MSIPFYLPSSDSTRIEDNFSAYSFAPELVGSSDPEPPPPPPPLLEGNHTPHSHSPHGSRPGSPPLHVPEPPPEPLDGEWQDSLQQHQEPPQVHQLEDSSHTLPSHGERLPIPAEGDTLVPPRHAPTHHSHHHSLQPPPGGFTLAPRPGKSRIPSNKGFIAKRGIRKLMGMAEPSSRKGEVSDSEEDIIDLPRPVKPVINRSDAPARKRSRDNFRSPPLPPALLQRSRDLEGADEVTLPPSPAPSPNHAGDAYKDSRDGKRQVIRHYNERVQQLMDCMPHLKQLQRCSGRMTLGALITRFEYTTSIEHPRSASRKTFYASAWHSRAYRTFAKKLAPKKKRSVSFACTACGRYPDRSNAHPGLPVPNRSGSLCSTHVQGRIRQPLLSLRSTGIPMEHCQNNEIV
jgi:hypothetical protein